MSSRALAKHRSMASTRSPPAMTTVTDSVDGMRERDLPLHVFRFECFGMRAQTWRAFERDAAAFPDPEGMPAWLKVKRLSICGTINPCIAQRSMLRDAGTAKGCLLRARRPRLATGQLLRGGPPRTRALARPLPPLVEDDWPLGCLVQCASATDAPPGRRIYSWSCRRASSKRAIGALGQAAP
ncbi:MAG: hypothetical protein JO223_13980, partial [Hyphomicrobiales bacterium]|nr:hypothetical protein [Hyphomicrobiales bacterium]